jgi:hypothetical protein
MTIIAGGVRNLAARLAIGASSLGLLAALASPAAAHAQTEAPRSTDATTPGSSSDATQDEPPVGEIVVTA